MKCWFWNISVSNLAYLRDELEAGRLRQGWGYEEGLNLLWLQARIHRGEKLSKAEQVAWDRCSPMVEAISPGDLVVVKNIPSTKEFTVVETVGPYSFDLGIIGDFGHILPVVGRAVYHKQSAVVPAPFVTALNREQNPIRITHKHRKTVVILSESTLFLKEVAAKPEGLKERVEHLKRELAVRLKELLKERTDPTAAEKLVFHMLQRDGLSSLYNAGAHEKGADVLTEMDCGYGLSTKVAVQVKQHWGTEGDTRGLAQLRQAFDEHDVDAGLLVTFADRLSEGFRLELENLKREYKVEVIYGEELYDRLLELVVDSSYDLDMD